MKNINIANQKKRDAVVDLEGKIPRSKIQYVLPDGSLKSTIRILRNTIETDFSSLEKQYGDLDSMAEDLLYRDPDVDIEKEGLLLSNTKKVLVNNDNKIVYNVHLTEIIKNPDNTIKEQRVYKEPMGNIDTDIPIKWSGKTVPREAAIRKFVFSRKYMLRHVNGLTYDFLYEMAKKLHDENCLMLVGAGEKGNEPLIFTNGGVPYRGFLEGRIKDDKYCLLLHLTNLELKEIN